MAYSYKGSISFGLVYIPVKLHAATANSGIGFNMLDRETLSRVKYMKTCVDCDGREVKQEDIVKGYEYEKDKYVVFTDNDFEKIKTKQDKNITIEQFVDLSEVDPVYYDRSFYVEPTGADKAFRLLLTAMEEQGKAGIAKTVLGNKETLILMRARNGQMMISTLFFQEEIKRKAFQLSDEEIKPAELALARTIIESLSGAFAPEQYRDEYKQRLQDALAAKIAGKEIHMPKQAKETPVSDLMDALQKSLQSLGKDIKPKSKPKTAVKTNQKTTAGGKPGKKISAAGKAKNTVRG